MIVAEQHPLSNMRGRGRQSIESIRQQRQERLQNDVDQAFRKVAELKAAVEHYTYELKQLEDEAQTINGELDETKHSMKRKVPHNERPFLLEKCRRLQEDLHHVVSNITVIIGKRYKHEQELETARQELALSQKTLDEQSQPVRMDFGR